MRNVTKRRASVCLVFVFIMAAVSSRASTFNWAGGGGLNWSDPLNWDTVPSSGTLNAVVFDTNVNTGVFGSGTLVQNIANPIIIGSIIFGSNAGTFVTGTGTFSVGTASVTVTQNSPNAQFLNHGFRGSATATNVLTLTGNGSGIVTISGPISEPFLQGVAVTKSGTSTYILTNDTAVSTTTIAGGALQTNSGAGFAALSLIQLRGGVLQSNGNTSILFSRSLGSTALLGGINWGTGGGGFSAGAGGTMTVRIGNSTATQTWAATNFVPSGQPLILSSNSATGLVDWQNGLQLGTTGTNTRTITVNDNANLTTDFARMSGTIQGSSGNTLFKDGPGLLQFTAQNTFTGPTIVNAGALSVLNTGTIAGSVQVNAGANFDVSDFNGSGGFTFSGGRTLSGKGSVTGKVKINSTGAISPGNSVGALATQDAEFGAGGVYNWELNDASGSAGTGFDQIQLTGGLSITSSAGNEFVLKIASLNGTSAGDAANFDPNQNYSWIIATTTGGVSNFDPTAFTIDRTAFTNDTSGSQGSGFSLSTDGNNLILNYDGVPEPAIAGLLAVGALTWLTRRPRRRVGCTVVPTSFR